MNYEMILDDLKNWDEDELFYRDYFHLDKTSSDLAALLKRTNPDSDYIDFALHPEHIDPLKTEEVFFTSGRNVNLIKHPRYLPFFTHKHNFFEILYVVSGNCIQVLSEQRTELSQGDLCLLAPNVTHGIEVFDDSIVLNILIRRSTFMDIFINTIRDKSQIALFFLGNLYEKNKIRYLLYHPRQDMTVRNYILDMYIEQMHPDDFSDRIICSLLTIFFTQLTRRHGRTVEIPDALNRTSEYADEMLHYIIANHSTITLSKLADHFHFSVPYCSKLIKIICGSTFSELITKVRLQQGESLLIHTQMSIADISDRIGYKNPETFIRCFSRFYQRTPSQFRKENPLD